jgi:membrane protein implicated in regulation of membrane protease activity
MFNFSNVVEPAKKLIKFYQKIPESILNELPNDNLNKIKNQADQDYNRLQQIINFSPDVDKASSVRDSYILQIIEAYTPTFKALHDIISYSLHKSADFKKLEGDARATFQSIKDKSDELVNELQNQNQQASKILEEIRKVAAEQGVTQQSVYYKETSDHHAIQAKKWLWATIAISIVLFLYAGSTLFYHKIMFLAPIDQLQLIQFIISKILIFLVVSYMLYLSARNFLSHKHNEIVNKQRQNALLTYKAFVVAAGEAASQEAILIHAAACIFSIQPTGYTRDGTEGQIISTKSLIDLVPK